MDHDRDDWPTVDQLLAALHVLRCEGPATAADVLEITDRRWPRDLRDEVLRRMSAVERT